MAPRNRKRLVVLILVLLGGTLNFVILDRTPELPAVMILPPAPLAVKSGRVPDRWIPRNWDWLRRVCLFVFGQPRQVVFEIQFMEVSETVASVVAENSLGPPQAKRNGVAVWMLSAGTLQPPSAPRPSSPPRARISTSDRGQARLRVGDYSADLYARLQEKTLDLSTCLIVASPTQSNFVATARAQLPYGQALFVLDVRQPELATNRFAFLVTAHEIDATGNMVHGKAPGK
jgi:hypothetical protein